MVYIQALNGSRYHDFGAYVCTMVVPGPFCKVCQNLGGLLYPEDPHTQDLKFPAHKNLAANR